MKYFKIFFLLVLINLSGVLVFAQTAQVLYITVTPSQYQDTVNQPSVIIEGGKEKSISQENAVQHESKSVIPQSKLSIGTASAVPAAAGENSTPSEVKEKSAVNHNEQKVEKQELPVSNPALNPK